MDKKKTVVVALGHRALGSTLPEQQRATKEAAKAIADLAETGANVVISHSNSQQVGMIHMAMNEFAQNHPEYTTCPMSVCSAMSQGYIGYDLQNAIRAELITRGIYRPVSTVLTQVLVDPYDEAFYEPTKIIGRLLTKEEADAEEKKGNFVTKVEDGFRRIVASPAPKEIIELDAIKALVKDDQIVICCGGGGIPVIETEPPVTDEFHYAEPHWAEESGQIVQEWELLPIPESEEADADDYEAALREVGVNV